MLSKLKTGLLILAGILGLIFTAFLKGRSAGKAVVEEEVRQQEVKDVKAVAESASKKSRKSKMFSKMLFAVLISLLTMSCSTTGPRPDSGK